MSSIERKSQAIKLTGTCSKIKTGSENGCNITPPFNAANGFGFLAAQKLDLKTVLDYGCGSGILGIASLLLGAKSAQGIDIDPQALIASKENARRNALDEQSFPVFFPSKYPKAEHDFVLANILAGPLVELAEELIVLLTPGGKLCLSGILETQVDTIISAYEHKIDFAPPTVKESWACITGQKRVS